jgi:hypothetical protein
MDIGWVCLDLFRINLKRCFCFYRSGSYEIESLLDDVQRGTTIRCYLRDDCAEFSKEETVKRKKNKLKYFIFSFFFNRNCEKI